MSDFLDSVIPAQPQEASLVNPRSLVIYKDFKVGGSAIASWLSLHRKALWLDLEDGSGAMPGRAVNVLKTAMARKMGLVEFTMKLLGDLTACNPLRYDFLIIDKVDQFETWADKWAVADYQRTIIGRDFKGTSMAEVPYIGWSKWEEKFLALWTAARMAAPYVIFICSMKTASSKFGEHGTDAAAGMVNSTDLDLNKRQRKIAVGDADATGLLWRADDGANYLSFKTREKGAYVGNRIPRLEGQTIKLSWLDKDRRLVVNWDELYKFPAVMKNGETDSISQSTSTTKQA